MSCTDHTHNGRQGRTAEHDARLELDLNGPYREAFTMMPAPLVILDAELKILDVNDAYLMMLSLQRANLVGRYLFEVFPASEEAAADAVTAESILREAIASGTSQYLPVFQYDTETAPGSGVFDQHWWRMTATPLLGEALSGTRPDGQRGEVVASAVLYRLDEVTDTLLEQRRAAVAEAAAADLAVREARLAEVVETMTTAFYTLDRSWRFVYINAAFERFVGVTREELIGYVMWELYPLVVGTETQQAFFDAVATGEVTTYETYYPEPLDDWYEGSVHPGPNGVAVYFSVVTHRHHAEDVARAVAARTALLAQVTEVLASAEDVVAATATLPRLLVPALGDWCILTLADHGDPAADETTSSWRAQLTHPASWHRDPDRRAALAAFAAQRPGLLSETSPTAGVARTGIEAVLNADDVQAVLQAPGATAAREAVGSLAPGATALIPVHGPERLLGLLTLARDLGTGDFETDVLDVAREVAARIGLSVDNARLHAAQRDLAEELQRSLLTSPAQPDHLQIAVRYAPAASGVQIGGDWYDAFVTSNGATSLVVGDVTGHDRNAAATMGQLRNLLRGIGHVIGQPPAAVLSALDRAAHDMGVDALATVVLAQVEQPAQEQAEVQVLHWSNAGHPPPLLITPQGSANYLEDPDSDLLIGLDPGTARRDHQVDLAPGTTVLLYTDGLIERRDTPLSQGLNWLAQAVTGYAHLSLEDLCDALLADVAGHLDDDVALLAVRARLQERTSPGGADWPPASGPTRDQADVIDDQS